MTRMDEEARNLVPGYRLRTDCRSHGRSFRISRSGSVTRCATGEYRRPACPRQVQNFRRTRSWLDSTERDDDNVTSLCDWSRHGGFVRQATASRERSTATSHTGHNGQTTPRNGGTSPCGGHFERAFVRAREVCGIAAESDESSLNSNRNTGMGHSS